MIEISKQRFSRIAANGITLQVAEAGPEKARWWCCHTVFRNSLVGHDWGAIAGWWAAQTYPQRIVRLAVMGAGHHAIWVDAFRHNSRQRRKSHYVRLFQIPWLPEHFSLGLPTETKFKIDGTHGVSRALYPTHFLYLEKGKMV